MINIDDMVAMMELYAGRAGVSNDKIPPKLAREIINLKLRDFAHRTNILETSVTIKSVANTAEYELPEDFITENEVLFDNYRATKIMYENVIEMQGSV